MYVDKDRLILFVCFSFTYGLQNQTGKSFDWQRERNVFYRLTYGYGLWLPETVEKKRNQVNKQK